ncbi:hypothetical protein B0H16DRAFT_1685960 [Mycena metata]|uniref:Uncharacterized protein n=1 Tax=Mycena metata TaxID=1033252 RepID=A0AAD7NP93_9AGAR|nr:hypothetical protein B0H16DRAFT_1685960 [Mycena metata]
MPTSRLFTRLTLPKSALHEVALNSKRWTSNPGFGFGFAGCKKGRWMIYAREGLSLRTIVAKQVGFTRSSCLVHTNYGFERLRDLGHVSPTRHAAGRVVGGTATSMMRGALMAQAGGCIVPSNGGK